MSTRKNITHKLFNFFQSKNIPDDVELLNSIIAGLEDETLTYLEVLTAIDGKEKQSFVDPRLSELYYLYSNGYEIPDLISIIKKYKLRFLQKEALEEKIKEKLEFFLKSRDFIFYKEFYYTRDNHNRIIDIIRFGGRITSTSYRFSCCIGKRFLLLEQLLDPENKDLSSPTITLPIYYLDKTQSSLEWEITSTKEFEDVINSVEKDILLAEEYFFSKITNIDLLKNKLESKNPSDWLALSYEKRARVLAAIAYINGDIEKAKTIIFHALQDERNQKFVPQKNLKELAKTMNLL